LEYPVKTQLKIIKTVKSQNIKTKLIT